MANYLRALREKGLRWTVQELYVMRQIKFGEFKGMDANGNKYYEDLTQPYGQHRWFRPAVKDSPSLVDASTVAPEWHGWLHSTTDLVPTSAVPERTGEKIAEGVSTPTEHHYNMEHRRPWRQNPTLNRERGYQIEHHFGKPGENNFYVTTGNIQSPLFEESGPKIEAWSDGPAAKSGSTVVASQEKWQEFYHQRQAMNKNQQEAKKE